LFPAPKFQAYQLLFFRKSSFEPANQSVILSQNKILQKQISVISSGSINDLPFFCAIECKVRKRTNIWIKIRAGDDATYMKMIEVANKMSDN